MGNPTAKPLPPVKHPKKTWFFVGDPPHVGDRSCQVLLNCCYVEIRIEDPGSVPGILPEQERNFGEQLGVEVFF